MTIPEAIEKAIKGGYKMRVGYEATYTTDKHTIFETTIFETPFLDPDFWRALGKTEGWEGYYNTQVFRAGKPTSTGGERLEKKEVYHRWQHEMHRLIDHLASDGTSESYFAAL